MGRKAKRYIVALLAAAVCFCGFAFTALADTTQNFQYGKIQRTLTGGYGADATGNGAGYGADANGNGAGYETDTAQVMLTFDLKGGSGLSNKNVDKGTKVGELKVPVRKGYDFAGWIVSGKKVSDSYTMNNDTFLTATWGKAESSSSSRKSAVGDGEDSSDDTTSSENEGALVSSAASSAAASSASASSQAASSDPHYSFLFYLGILLVALGLGGIVMLICRQIHNHHSGKGGPRASSGRKQDDGEFTDISSFSDGKKHHSR